MAYDLTTHAAQMLQDNLNEMPALEDVFGVKGKVAIVTGGSSGLGFNVTARLLQGGANVVMASFNEAEENNACGVLEAAGFGPDRVRFFKANVTDEEDLQNLIKFTDETFGSIDILVTCAAVWSYAQIYNMPKDEFNKVVTVNLTGTFLTVKHVSKYMIDHGIEGKMCLVSSNCAWLPYPTFGGYVHYAASKGSLEVKPSGNGYSLTFDFVDEDETYGGTFKGSYTGPVEFTVEQGASQAPRRVAGKSFSPNRGTAFARYARPSVRRNSQSAAK